MMIRPFTLFCAFFAGISGMVLYAQKHKTTQLDKEITKIVYDTQKIKSQTAMLRTEWTLLNQPDRLKKLANDFIPGLRPLDPSQFVQMASVASVLPPVQQEPNNDKTREELVKNVAQNNGQPVPDTTETIAENNNESSTTTVQYNSSRSQQHQVSDEPPLTFAKNNVTTQAATVQKPIHRKKIKSTEIADATDTIETQNFKKNHIQNVSYNIQNDNPFSHNKISHTRQFVSSQIPSNSEQNALEKKNTIKPIQKTLSNASSRRSTSIKVARNESNKSNFTESALGGDSDGALPAPVPFSR